MISVYELEAREDTLLAMLDDLDICCSWLRCLTDSNEEADAIELLEEQISFDRFSLTISIDHWIRL